MTNSDYRVSLKFSEKDVDQEEVVKLLKQMGRKKSAFITKAVKYYLSENPSANLSDLASTGLTKDTIKSMLKEVLAEMNLGEIQTTQSSSDKKATTAKKKAPIPKPEPKLEVEQEPEVTDDQVDDFLQGLEAWDLGEI